MNTKVILSTSRAKKARFLAALRRWCHDNGVVFIADEIQSGIARTGAWFACDHEGVVPDLVTTAKGLAGGTPLSAVTGSAEIMDSAEPGALGGTYCGNPLACAAALATLDMIEEQEAPTGPAAGCGAGHSVGRCLWFHHGLQLQLKYSGG